MSTSVRSTAASLRVFLEQIIDYAGLFPPASLDMRTSVNNYSRDLNAPQRWLLGRFVLPAARLDEFLNAQENVVADPWRLSAIISANIEADMTAVDEFNLKAPCAAIDTVEVRVRDLDEIDLVRQCMPLRTAVFFEFAPEQADVFLPVLRQFGGCAKLRTGGVVEEAFPDADNIAGFIARCAELGVPFKATAGLHHPLRSFRPLTYEPYSRECMMHGFLNVFTAAAIAWNAVLSGKAVTLATLTSCLRERERANWRFGEDALTWGGEEAMRIDVASLQSMRSKFALSFGSCSFVEPLQDLYELDLL